MYTEQEVLRNSAMQHWTGNVIACSKPTALENPSGSQCLHWANVFFIEHAVAQQL